MIKKFMFACFGILALAGAYAIGASNVTAQVGDQTIVAVTYVSGSWGGYLSAVTAQGDEYIRDPGATATWEYKRNVFGTPTGTQQKTLGGVKGQYR